MRPITLAVRASEDGTLTIPRGVVESLGLRPGEEAEIRLEADITDRLADSLDITDAITRLFHESDELVPEPGAPLTDPLEATWGAGVEAKYRAMGLSL